MKKFNNKYIYVFLSLIFMNIYTCFLFKYNIILLHNFIMTFSLCLSVNFYNIFLTNFKNNKRA